MEYKASAKNIRQSARKVRLVADLVRGKSITEAERLLKFSDKKAAKTFSKVLTSAKANAKDKNVSDLDLLVLSEARVDEGTTYKRHRFGGRGRVKPILKRTSHITIGLKEAKKGLKEKTVKKAENEKEVKDGTKS